MDPEIHTLFSNMISHAKSQKPLYSEMVSDIISRKSNDRMEIERILDLLLDLCFLEDFVELFGKLCRYYWDIDPAATARYINYYREEWDSE